MSRVRIAIVVAAAAAFFVPENAAAAVLRPGSHGQPVRGLQWLLSGHKPSAYRGISTFGKPPNGLYGPRTAEAVYRMKYRLGWPQWSLRGSGHSAGPFFLNVLQGKQKRPLDYLLRSAQRVKAPVPTTDQCDMKVAAVARRYIGEHEIPDGSNSGDGIPKFQAVTGAYHAAWCASFSQFCLLNADIGTIANRSAGVFYIVGWSRTRGYVHSRPKVGSLAAFVDGLGHVGVVVKVTAHGYVTVEGNSSNAVRERFHMIGDRPTVWIYPPHPKGGCK